MSTENYYKGIKDVIQIRSDSPLMRCGYCHTEIIPDMFDKSINHLIKDHDYKLLHVGTETSRDMDGKPWHRTVALLGK